MITEIEKKKTIVFERRLHFVAICQNEVARRQQVLNSMLRLDSGLHNYENDLKYVKGLLKTKTEGLSQDVIIVPGAINEEYPELYGERWRHGLEVPLRNGLMYLQQSRTNQERQTRLDRVKKDIPGFNLGLLVDRGWKPPVLLIGGTEHSELYEAAESKFGDEIFQIITGTTVLNKENTVFQTEGFLRLAPNWTKYGIHGAILPIEIYCLDSNGRIALQGIKELEVLGKECKIVVRTLYS